MLRKVPAGPTVRSCAKASEATAVASSASVSRCSRAGLAGCISSSRGASSESSARSRNRPGNPASNPRASHAAKCRGLATDDGANTPTRCPIASWYLPPSERRAWMTPYALSGNDATSTGHDGSRPCRPRSSALAACCPASSSFSAREYWMEFSNGVSKTMNRSPVTYSPSCFCTSRKQRTTRIAASGTVQTSRRGVGSLANRSH